MTKLFAHYANVAYLSLVIGMRINDYIVAQRRHVSQADAADLTKLGIGAMLHDLGYSAWIRNGATFIASTRARIRRNTAATPSVATGPSKVESRPPPPRFSCITMSGSAETAFPDTGRIPPAERSGR
ncbi:MAG: hypothetical protein GY778_18125 [bacterium]|nr:hypothetical protein [bacterium]